MNTLETINIEKYAEALNNLVGMDIGYLGDSDKNVNAIAEVIRAAKALEGNVEEWKSKYFQQVAEVQGIREMIREAFEEIDEFVNVVEWRSYWDEGKIRRKIAELRKKYLEVNNE